MVEAANLREPVIRGNFTLREATRLRDLLRAGSLPVSLSVETVNRIEPISGRTRMGSDSAGRVSWAPSWSRSL
jgi:preprotein translocase subunit SecD